MTDATIEADRAADGRIAVLRLARPDRHNVLDRAVLADLFAALEAADRDGEVDAIVLGSTGDDFCAGASLEELRELTFEEGARWMTAYFETLEVLRATGKPVVAAIEGLCVAGGHELVMACDLAVAGRSARLGQPEVGVGSTAGGGGAQLLPLLVGEKRARELLLTGRILEAETAHDWGLLNRVVDDGEAEAAAVELAREVIDAASPRAYRTIKAMLAPWSRFGLLGQELARDVTAATWATEEFDDRAEAFLAGEAQRPLAFHGTRPRGREHDAGETAGDVGSADRGDGSDDEEGESADR